MKLKEDVERKEQKKYLIPYKRSFFRFFKRINFKQILRTVFNIIILVLVLFASYISMELLNAQSLELSFQVKRIIYNCAIPLCMYFIIYGITNKSKISCTIVYTLIIIYGILNYIVLQARGVALTISDVYSIGTATSVAEGIQFDFNSYFYEAISLYAIAMLVLWIFVRDKEYKDKKEKRKKSVIAKRVISALIGISGLIYLISFDSYIQNLWLWDINSSYNEDGANVVFAKMIKDLKVKKPAGYKKEDLVKKLNEYEDDTVNYEGNLPNVIIVLDESFADLEDIYKLNLPEDEMPFFHKLKNEENVISGYMHSSEFGGGTANVEYELLTQNTTAFLPSGSIPYQQFISKNVDNSIVSYLNGLNYNTYGMHPYFPTGYSRSKIYKYLQFNNQMFLENFEGVEYGQNGYPNDIMCYRNLYKKLEEKPEGEKIFTFLLTMQNHVPYRMVDPNRIQYDEDPNINSYLQSIKASDEALEDLVNYIKNYNEDTIILFVGDHEPNLDEIQKYEVKDTHKEEEYKYITPFIIYANFDIEEQRNVETSTNYLQSILLEACGMPKNSYTKYISELRKEIPVLTSQYYKDNKGNMYMLNDKKSPYYNKIQEYWKLIYSQLFN